MVNALIGFREGLEAALIVGILLGFLKRTGRITEMRFAWLGVGLAIMTSLGVAALIRAIGMELEGRAEEIFEGVTMLLAALVVSGMVLWMRRNARGLKQGLETGMQHAIAQGAPLAVTLVSFTAVAREGVETALLLSATSLKESGPWAFLWALLGIGAAVLLGWLIYTSAVRANLRTFFAITSVMLVMFAAGLLGRSVHEFQEAGVLPSFNEALYDLSAWLSDDDGVGRWMKTMFGYLSAPSIESTLVYALYLVAGVLGLSGLGDRLLRRATSA